MTTDELKTLQDKISKGNITKEEKLAALKELNQLIEEMRADIMTAKISKQTN